MLTPRVTGMRLTGALREGVTATDLVLTVTQTLRKKGVVDQFVEFTGPGLDALSLADRATVANMAPEYGATIGFFPVDAVSLAYLRLTGRNEKHVDLVERYLKEQGLFRTASSPEPTFSDLVELDLSTVEPSLAGPKRPQDRVPLTKVKSGFRALLPAPPAERGFGLSEAAIGKKAVMPAARAASPSRGGVATAEGVEVGHGVVVIAAITSCTNTSNP